MKKNHHSSTKENAANPPFGIDGQPFFEWLIEHAQTILYSLLGAFSLLFILYFWLASGSTKAEKDYITASEQFYIFENPQSNFSQKEKDEALANLTQLMKSHPDLQAKFDAPIAQILINDKNQQAKIFANSAFQRVSKDNIPFYLDFAKITLLISQNQFNEAINESVALNGKMIEALNQSENEASLGEFGPFLFAYNLLRTAFLYQYSENPDEEMKIWDQWKSFTSGESTSLIPNIDRKAFFTISQLFSDGSVSLDQYIDMRIQKLTALQEKL